MVDMFACLIRAVVFEALLTNAVTCIDFVTLFFHIKQSAYWPLLSMTLLGFRG